MPHPVLRLLAALALLVVWPVFAAEEAAAPASGPSEAAAEPAPEALRTPRATMETFLHAMNDIKRGEPDRIADAVSTLDLSAVNQMIRKERGRDLAWTLLEVLDRTRIVDTGAVPDYAQGEPYVFERYADGRVRISRRADGRWLFDQETVAKLPEILDGLGDAEKVKGGAEDARYLPWHLRVRETMPAWLKQAPFLLENWRWIGILVTIALGLLLDRLASLLLRVAVRRWKAQTRRAELEEVSDDLLRPLGLMVMAFLWWVGINLLALPEGAMLILLVAVKFLAGLSMVWAAYRLVDLVSLYLLERARRTRTRLDDALVPLIPKTLKIFVTVVGIVFVADNLNIDITSLLAGLGLGGLAFALAAKDLVQNLFGSVSVLLDRTFSVGDWVVIGDVEGTVERIGFRSTRLRTFYNSLVTLPNSQLITASVDNMGQRRYRRMSTRLAVTYDTPPDRIEAFCEGIRELVRRHPYMRKDFFHVYFNEYGAASLNILVYVFWETPDWSTELRERHRFLLDILRLAHRLEVEFAFPTQTLYIRQDGEPGPGGPERAQSEAFETGRREARRIVEETLGADVRPPPVSF